MCISFSRRCNHIFARKISCSFESRPVSIAPFFKRKYVRSALWEECLLVRKMQASKPVFNSIFCNTGICHLRKHTWSEMPLESKKTNCNKRFSSSVTTSNGHYFWRNMYPRSYQNVLFWPMHSGLMRSAMSSILEMWHVWHVSEHGFHLFILF